MKPVLFLDIDGVLNSDAYERKNRSFQLRADADPDLDDTVTVPLGAMLRKLHCNVVLISFWRHDRPGLQTIRRLVSAGLHSVTLEFLPGTEGSLDGVHPTRAELITQYLKKHPSIRRFAIADDEQMEDAALSLRQVKPNPAEGLTPIGLKKLRKLLRKRFWER